MILNESNGIIEVRRTSNNYRARPNAQKRHDLVEDDLIRGSSKHFINQDDLEWMSINYRKERAAKICYSRRRMILIMFQEDLSYFPTLTEIRDELVQAQIFEL